MTCTFDDFVAVVRTTLTQSNIRLMEANRQIRVCVMKDLETAVEFNVTVETQDGTATSEWVDCTSSVHKGGGSKFGSSREQSEARLLGKNNLAKLIVLF